MADLRSRTLTRQTGPIVGRDIDRWQDAAACAAPDVDAELFFDVPDERPGQQRTARVAAAKSVCRGCDVRDHCLTFAMTTRQSYGIWGGLDEHERAHLRRGQVRP